MDASSVILTQWRRRVRSAGGWALFTVLAMPCLAPAQASPEDLVLLQTDSGTALTTEVRSVAWGDLVASPFINFRVGFSTDESPGPGQIFDSFTVTLQTDDAGLTILLLTVDAAGLVVAPPTPGTFPLDPGDVTLTDIDFPDLQPVLAHRSAFDVNAVLPEELAGRTAILFFDLYNNDNGVPSLGWFAENIVVPEPSSLSLMLAALAGLCAHRLWKRKRL